MSYTKNRYDSYLAIMFNEVGNGVMSEFTRQLYPIGGFVIGDYNPSWRSLVRAGANATTACQGTIATISPGFLDVGQMLGPIGDPSQQYYYGLTGEPLLYSFSGFNDPPPGDLVTDITNRAIRKFLDAADSARSSIELGQDLGEWKETIHGITHPLQTLREFTFSHLSKVLKLTKSVKHKASLTKMVADTWLEFKFGWFPLAADVGKAYADVVNNMNHTDIQPIRGSAYGTFPILTDVFINSIGAGQVGINIKITVIGSYSVTYKGAVKTEASNGRLGLQQMMQLDLPHFVPTIWDLIPYSWVVDYFTNCGDIIRGLCFNVGQLAWGNKTVRITHDYTYDYSDQQFNAPPLGWMQYFKNSVTVNPTGQYVSFQRSSISPDELVPQFQITLPLGSLKPWENMAALLLGRQKEISRVASNIR